MEKCPALAQVIIKYLACPPTSDSSEKLLSTEDAVAPDDRLVLVHVPQLVLAKYNLEKCQ